MRLHTFSHFKSAGLLALAVGLLSACGGAESPQAEASSSAPAVQTQAEAQTVGAQAAGSSTITDIKIVDTSGLAHTKVPVTFGQVFAAGDFPQGRSLLGMMGDGSVIPLQVDAKALNADGSVRHAVISGVLPQLAGGATRTISFVTSATSPPRSASLSPSGLVHSGFAHESSPVDPRGTPSLGCAISANR